ncbi:hypothetical protein Tco_1537154 [Tanacetum coccineum]
MGYSLTVNPTVYVSYIKQFWSTIKTKTANNETQIYAKVAGKSVVVTESSVNSDLHFNDEDGATCLTTVEIFENLALMGYERLVRSIANFVPIGAKERVKRPGPELQSDTSKKQKTTEVKEVPVTEEPLKEPTAPKQE